MNKAKAAWHNTQEFKWKQYVAYDRATMPARQDVWKASDSDNMKRILSDPSLRQSLFKIYQDPATIKIIAEVCNITTCIRFIRIIYIYSLNSNHWYVNFN